MTLYDHKTSRDIRFVCNRIPLIEDGEIIGGVAISTFNEMGEIYHLYSEVEKMQQVTQKSNRSVAVKQHICARILKCADRKDVKPCKSGKSIGVAVWHRICYLL